MKERSALSPLLSVIGVLALLVPATKTCAQSIEVQVSSTEAFVGEALDVRVIVSNIAERVTPVPPVTKEFEIQLQPGVGTSRSVENRFGRMTEHSSFTYTYQVRPMRPGRFTLPPFTVQYKGLTYQTNQVPITVQQDTTSDLLFCEIKTGVDSAYVGQEIGLTLEIWIQQYQQAGIGALGANDMWNLLLRSLAASNLGGFDKVDWRSAKYGETTRPDGQGVPQKYFMYVLETKVYPNKEGPLEFGGVAIAYEYPRRLARGFFGLELADVRRLRAAAKTPEMQVLPISTEGRPSDFSGAVGRYEIVTTAKPTEVPVGDPITLSLRIKGDSSLDQLLPPKLSQVETLTQDFDVSGESLAGEIEGPHKVFSQTIRPLREEVTQIPPIPISYFDPLRKQFGTSWSEPIAIKVKPAERLAISALNGPGSLAPVLAPLVETTAGLLANETDPAAILADQAGGANAGTFAMLIALPALYVTTWLAHRRSARYRDDESLRRRSRAYAAAKKALNASEGPASPGRVRAALVGYIADRCGAPAGGITRTDAVKLLADRGVPPETVQAADELLAALELTEYGGQAAGSGVSDSAAARTLVDALEKYKLR